MIFFFWLFLSSPKLIRLKLTKMNLKTIKTFIFLFITTLAFSQDKVGDISIEYGEEITEEKGKIVNIM